KDAGFELREYEVQDDFRKILTENLIADYATKRRIMSDRIAEDRLEGMRSAVFGDAPLLPLEGYSPEFSSLLIKANLSAFESIRPMSVIKSFLAAFYLPSLRPALTKAIVELDFRDIEFRTALSDEADSLGGVAESITTFEAFTISVGRVTLLGALDPRMTDRAEINKANREIADLNSKADVIVQETFSHASGLLQRVQALMNDIKSRSPELVSNAGLINVHHPKTVKGLEEAQRLLDLFYILLQNIAVDTNAAKQAIAG
ncbi:MAG: hypothetical protein WCT14_20705, partial [Treponemataceae bacterium]